MPLDVYKSIYEDKEFSEHMGLMDSDLSVYSENNIQALSTGTIPH